ncbi:mCG148074 [Mus musculus]|nr:mCG148074 [Mus musculus]
MKVSWGEKQAPPDAGGCLVCLLTATSTRKPPLSAAQHAARCSQLAGIPFLERRIKHRNGD